MHAFVLSVVCMCADAVGLSLSVNALSLSLHGTLSDSKSILGKGLRGALNALLHELVPFPLDVIGWTAPRAI